MNIDQQLHECAEARRMLEYRVAEQQRIIDDQCDTIVDLVVTLDARDMQ